MPDVVTSRMKKNLSIVWEAFLEYKLLCHIIKIFMKSWGLLPNSV
jgi:hypothetical protein